MKWLGEYMKKYQIIVTVTVPEKDDLQLPEDPLILLFQSVRELLINSSKHAGINQADVRLERHEGQLRIAVSDQGAGFDLAAAAAEIPSGGISSRFGLSVFKSGCALSAAHWSWSRPRAKEPPRCWCCRF